MTPTLKADSLADLLQQGRQALQQQRTAEALAQEVREAEQRQRDREHWRACRAIVCRDLPAFLIQHSNVTAEPPEGWTGGSDRCNGTLDFTLTLNCPGCVEVRRSYRYAHWVGTQGPEWRAATSWQAPTWYTSYDEGRCRVRVGSYADWHQGECLATALAWAEDYHQAVYVSLFAEMERRNADLAEEAAQPTDEAAQAEPWRFAIRRQVAAVDVESLLLSLDQIIHSVRMFREAAQSNED